MIYVSLWLHNGTQCFVYSETTGKPVRLVSMVTAASNILEHLIEVFRFQYCLGEKGQTPPTATVQRVALIFRIQKVPDAFLRTEHCLD